MRIADAFERARQEDRLAFVPYVVAGFPDPATSRAVAVAAVDSGADVVEIGLPYSDPVADGTTLQRASQLALRSGGSFGRSVELIDALHRVRRDVPIVVMCYVNQLLGVDNAGSRMHQLAESGVSGVILADLTPDEGEALEESARAAELALVYLVSPTTRIERRAHIASATGGFLYAVSLVGVTGARQSLAQDVAPFLRGVRAVSPVPVAVGFGISRPAHVRRLAALADGVIVASALVDALGMNGTDVPRMASLARSLRAAAGTRPTDRSSGAP